MVRCSLLLEALLIADGGAGRVSRPRAAVPKVAPTAWRRSAENALHVT